MNYFSERISLKNLSQLYALFYSEHGKKFNQSYFEKKFKTEWTGKKYIGFIMLEKTSHNASAFYGGFPCYVINKESSFLALQSGDTITHRDHRKKGLFVQLANKTYDLAKNEGFSFVFGFPNDNSSHGFYNKLEWSEIGKMTNFTFQTKGFNWYGLLHKFSPFSFIYTFYWNFLVKKFEVDPNTYSRAWSQSNSASKIFRVLKDEPYVKYKLRYSNSKIISFNKNYYWIKRDNGISIGDIILNGDTPNLKEELIHLAKFLGVNKLHFSFNENHEMHNLLREFCISKEGNSIGIKSFLSDECDRKFVFVKADFDDY